MPTLYVTEQGARLEKEHRRFLVTKEDEVLLAVPAARLSHVVLVGQVGVTTPALHAVLESGGALSLVNRAGKLLGRLLPPTGKNVALRHRQYERSGDAAFCLAVSRAIVGGKLRNCRALARRWARGARLAAQAEQAVTQIDRVGAALRATKTAADLAALRGLEGAGTRAYFAVWRAALEPGLGFERRTRRPPGDPANALLSLGYTLLTQNLIAACEIVGLDPYDGFFHADKYGRPALALDLVEEWRPVIVDSLVLNLVNRNMVGPADFEAGADGGVYLKRAALRTFFEQYTARLNTAVVVAGSGRRLTYQRWFEVQAMGIRRAIEGSAAEYVPFVTR